MQKINPLTAYWPDLEFVFKKSLDSHCKPFRLLQLTVIETLVIMKPIKLTYINSTSKNIDFFLWLAWHFVADFITINYKFIGKSNII